jgi:hypothetical protein
MSTTTIATILSGIIGLLLGHFPSRSWQLQQWKLENRKAEYRELLSKLSAGFTAALYLLQLQRYCRARESIKAENAATSCIRDRIFIVDEIREYDLHARWTGALYRFDHNLRRESAAKFAQIRSDLVRIALRDFDRVATMEGES